MSKNLRASAIAIVCGLFFFPAQTGVAAVEATPASFIIKPWRADDEGLPQNKLPASSVIAMTLRRDGYLWLGTRNGLVRFDGMRFTVFDQHNTPGLNDNSIVFLFEDSRTNLWIGTEIGGVALLKTDGQVRSLDIGRGSFLSRLVSACEDSSGAVWLCTADGQLCRYKDDNVDVWKESFRSSNKRFVLALKPDWLVLGTDFGIDFLGPTTSSQPRQLPSRLTNLFAFNLEFVLPSADGGFWLLAEGRVKKWRGFGQTRDFAPYPWRSNAYISAACEDREGNLIVGTLGVNDGFHDSANDGVYWFGADGKAAHIWHEQGLSHDGILSLAVDREGALWVGTDGGGLNRVTRNYFTTAPAARGQLVQSVSENENGLWFGIPGQGVTQLDGSQVKNFGASEGFTKVWSVFADKNQRVWVGSGEGLFKFENGNFGKIPNLDTKLTPVFAIHQDRGGVLWFGTQGGLMRWDGRGDPVPFANDVLSANAVRAFADDAEGNVWIGTLGGGLNRFHDGKFIAFGKTNGLPSENISSLFVDRDGVLWVGTSGGGLARFHGNRFASFSTDDGLANNSIFSVIEDDNGFLWIASGAGLMRVSKKSLNDFAVGGTNSIQCRTYDKRDGLPTSEFSQGSQPLATRARDGKLWFATVRGLVGVNPAQLTTNSFAPPVVIESITLAGQPQNTNSLRAGAFVGLVIRAGQERLEIRYASLNLASAERTRFKYWMEGHDTAWTDDENNSRVARYPKLPPGNYRFRVIAANEDGLWNGAGASFAVTVLPQFWQTGWFRVLAGIVLVGITISIVHYLSTQRLQRQLERLRQQEALEKERSRIARDLHDQLGANLTQVALLGELAETDKNLPDEVETHAKQISETARETTRALDEIVWAANPSNDTLEGLVNYACKHAQEFLAVAGLRYRLDAPGNLPDATIPPEVRHNVFLAFKEAVNNVVKHARATEVCVRLRLQPEAFTIEVEDNGRGMADGAEKSGRSGLRNMRKRMEDIGGQFSIAAGTSGGITVRLAAKIVNRKS